MTADERQDGDEQALDIVERALWQALDEATSTDTRYHIRKTLQYIEVLRS